MSRYTLTLPIPQATSSNRDHILAVYCMMAIGQAHMPFPYFPLFFDKCEVRWDITCLLVMPGRVTLSTCGMLSAVYQKTSENVAAPGLL